MIKNQKQATLTKERLEQLLHDKATFEASANERGPAELLIGLNSFDALIKDLSVEIEEYNGLTRGNLHIIEARTLDDTAKLLIGARIAQKISHRELAERIGIKEQQIQRYEATDYESASLSRISEIATALDLKCYYEKIIIICNETSFELPDDLSPDSVADAQSQIKKRGTLFCIE